MIEEETLRRAYVAASRDLDRITPVGSAPRWVDVPPAGRDALASALEEALATQRADLRAALEEALDDLVDETIWALGDVEDAESYREKLTRLGKGVLDVYDRA